MKIHIIAIGGAAMHQLAIALKKEGHCISGSDDEIRDPARSNLAFHQILPATEGWDIARITPDVDIVITGMHARKDNPELLRAIEMGKRIYSMPEYVYESSKNKKRVVIGGSHGKTTITAMIMHVLRFCGMDFDYLVGSSVRGFDQMVKLSEKAPVIVIEGDEYLTSPLDPRPKFHVYKPDIGVISGIAWDHINVFPSFEMYLEQFREFVRLIPEQGLLFASANDKNATALLDEFEDQQRFQRYEAFPYCIENGVYYLLFNGLKFPLKVFGDHNLQNISAAYKVCEAIGVTSETFVAAISEFEGAARRLEQIAVFDQICVYRDFAHSPSKLKATIEAMKAKDPEAQVIAIFELHTFSSLSKDFLPQYHGSMDHADLALVYFNSHTFEHKKLLPFTEKEIESSFGKSSLLVSQDSDKMSTFVIDNMKKKSNILLMSSGNFNGWNLELFLNAISDKNSNFAN